MLNTLVLLMFVAGGLASKLPHPQLRESFDKDKAMPLSVEGRPYNLKYRGQKNPVFVSGPVNEGLVLDGKYYLEASGSDIEDNCITDVELCEKGFTVAAWVKRQTPWEGGRGAQYIVSMGEGIDNSFGVKIAIRRRTLFFSAYGRQQWQKVQCSLPEDHATDGWMHLALKGNGLDKPIVPFMNGDKMKECKEPIMKTFSEPTAEIISEIVVGARQDPDTGDYIGFYQGVIDDLQWFQRSLEINEIRDLYRHGKDFLIAQANEENAIEA